MKRRYNEAWTVPCKIIKDSSAYRIYESELIYEGTDTDMSSTMNTGSF